MNLQISGASTLIVLVPFVVGAAVCGATGLFAGLYIVLFITDRITDRLVRQFNIYDAVLATGIQRIQARRKRRAEKTR